MPPGSAVSDQALVPSTASFWLAQLCSSFASGESPSWLSWLPEIPQKRSHWTSCATELATLMQKKDLLEALARVASLTGLQRKPALTGLQRKPTLFQKRQLLQRLAALARLRWKATLLQT